ncbi:MAG: hypothetical protein RLZZ500_1716 [Bacteroidota bacterium]|jgi:hypothetical protein
MRKCLSLIVCVLSIFITSAQGCSDAGVCTANALNSKEANLYTNTLSYSAILGKGESDVFYVSHFLAYTKQWNPQFSFSAKVTLSTAKGSFGTRTQFGDAFLVGNYLFKTKKKSQWGTILGLKFPFTASNLKINGYSLPLDYQSSLGTIDVFIGGNWRNKNWNVESILQVPFVNLNKNSYFAEYSGTTDFPSTNLFKRQPDALLKVGYRYAIIPQKFSLTPSLLAVYHLGEDSFTNIFNQQVALEGSSGLTVNGVINAVYSFQKNQQIECTLATPFAVREVRPDGLTRSLVFALQYNYSF